MPITDQARIAAERDRPRITALWQALTALKSTVSFMNTGAHPDDEISAMLAAMRFRDGIDVSYACSTRGEGGQNDIGTETTEALGVLRTAEMEAACDRLDLRMYWLSVSPDDTIFDFGFSKSGKETLAKWGRNRTLARFVDIIRTEKPDIICPTFLDVPGQHGHHRAMTEAAHDVMTFAADVAFDGSTLPAWQVKKMYLPAWSGAGQSYDDDLPPPPATLTFPAAGRDPVTGWTYEHIAQQSRVMHATQGMGRWVPMGQERDFPLHLVTSHLPGPDLALTSGLAQNLRDLDLPGVGAAQDACDAAIAAFPDASQVLRQACIALKALRNAMANCPADSMAVIGHKLSRKEQQLSQVIHLAAGVDARAVLSQDMLHPGNQTRWQSEAATDIGDLRLTPNLPSGWVLDGDTITLDADAATSDPYPAIYLPGQPQAPCIDLELSVHGIDCIVAKPFEVPPVVSAPRSASLSPMAEVINLADSRREVMIAVDAISPAAAKPALQVPDRWTVSEADSGFVVTVPDDAVEGIYNATLTLQDKPAHSVRHLRRDHIAPRVLASPAVTRICIVNAQLPDVAVGYVGGGNDRVGHWLARLGVNLTDFSDTTLTDAALAAMDTIVIGIFAMKSRPGLAEAMPCLHAWIREGGTLVTLYHRPWDNWNPDTIPPHRLEIGQPSLRWRITDETAHVTHIAPDHPILNHPNQIGPADWDGWHKERGLYFARDWDAAYTPLLEMSDPDETAQRGALLCADIGQGRHIHTSLILHHQMEKLTPGAFRLIANMLAKRS